MTLSHPFRDGESLEQKIRMLNGGEHRFAFEVYEAVVRDIRAFLHQNLKDLPFRVGSLSDGSGGGHIHVSVPSYMVSVVRETLPGSILVNALHRADLDFIASQVAEKVAAQLPDVLFFVDVDAGSPVIHMQGEHTAAVTFDHVRIQPLTHEEYHALKARKEKERQERIAQDSDEPVILPFAYAA